MDLKNISSLSELMDYANKYYDPIGIGSSRVVFKINDTKVLKVALNNAGLAQNTLELFLSKKSPLLAKIFNRHPENFWIIMELAEPATENDFLSILGFNFTNLSEYILLHFFHVEPKTTNEKLLHKIKHHMFTKELISFTEENNMTDVRKLNNWGKVKRNNNPTLVLIDFGLDENLYGKYYTPQYYKL